MQRRLQKLHTRLCAARVGKNVLPVVGPDSLQRDLALLLPLGGLLGAAVFLAVFGVGLLNPTNVEWLENSWGDLQQHYTGWAMYRRAAWGFPLGMMDGLTYPYEVSITYSDSIPLLAVFFKLLSPVLPATFQYFGLWGLLCYCLTGLVGAALVRSFCANKLYCLAGSGFLCLASPIIHRIFMHSALAAQWILLLALAFWAYGDYLRPLKRFLPCWCGLLFLASWVHPYFIPMVAGILLASLLHSLLASRAHPIAHVAALLLPLLTSLLALWAIGAFAGGGSMQNGGLGQLSFNLNGFFNPIRDSWASLLPAWPIREGQADGYAYMGAGGLLLLALAGALALWRFMRSCVRCGIRQTLRRIPLGAVCLLGIAVVFGVLALSPVVTANTRVLFTIPYPGFITSILMIFRSTGRFIWVPLYILMLGGLWLLARWAPRRVAAGTLCALLLLQAWDMAPMMAFRRDLTFYGEDGRVLQSDSWDTLAATHQHLVLETLNDVEYGVFLGLGTYAVRHGATLSNYYLARNLPQAEETIWQYYTDAMADTLPADTAVLIFNEQNATILRWLADGGAQFYSIDGVVVCTAVPLKGIAEEPLPALDGPLDVLAGLPCRLYLAEEAEGGILIQPTGDVRGQRVNLFPGSYSVRFAGKGLQAGHVRVHSELLGKDTIPCETAANADGSITLRFALDETVTDMEFWVENPLEEDILLTGIWLDRE